MPKEFNLAKNEIEEINKIVTRTQNYKEAIPKDVSLSEGVLSTSDAIGGGLELEKDKSVFYKYLSNEKLNELIKAINNNAEICTILEPTKKDKHELIGARNIAALKGFNIPFEAGQINNWYGMDEKELQKPLEAVKKALIELSKTTNISREEYLKAVINQSLSILKEENIEISSQKLEQYEKFITPGDKSPKLKKTQNLSEEDIKVVDEGAKYFIKMFNINVQVGKLIPKLQELKIQNFQNVENLVELAIKVSHNKEQDKSTKFIENFALLLENPNKKLVKATQLMLNKIDTSYLIENNSSIFNELKAVQNKNASPLGRIKKVFTSRDNLEIKLEEIVDKHIKESKDYINKNQNTHSKELNKEQNIYIEAQNILNETLESSRYSKELNKEQNILNETLKNSPFKREGAFREKKALLKNPSNETPEDSPFKREGAFREKKALLKNPSNETPEDSPFKRQDARKNRTRPENFNVYTEAKDIVKDINNNTENSASALQNAMPRAKKRPTMTH